MAGFACGSKVLERFILPDFALRAKIWKND
jgi:hypothetical protein